MVSERFQGANVIDAGVLSPYWGEHTARYSFALPFVKDKKVLDIACGTGYGLAFLKSAAKSVTGVDLDAVAVKQALSECDAKASVLLGDGTNLPFHDESFDVVTSFETLEHLQTRSLFLSELKRVLKPNGLLILSTPNANYTKPINGKPKNKYHVFEYKPEELRSELNSQFDVQKFIGQTLDASFTIPPFYDAQQELSKDFATQTKLFGWKVLNKMPLAVREGVSNAIWKKPFYPTESDYHFTVETIENAPVLVAVCQKI